MNENVKTALCDWIWKTATDEELVQFASDLKTRKQREQKLVTEIADFVGFSKITGKAKDEPVAVERRPVAPVFQALPPTNSTAAVLTTPPGDASAKIGGETREKIRAHLKSGPDTLGGIAALIKRPPGATSSLLKLLWERKELIYDGQKFMLRA